MDNCSITTGCNELTSLPRSEVLKCYQYCTNCCIGCSADTDRLAFIGFLALSRCIKLKFVVQGMVVTRLVRYWCVWLFCDVDIVSTRHHNL